MTRAVELSQRFDTIESRLSVLGAKLAGTAGRAAEPATSSDTAALYQRYAAVHSRLAAIEHRLRIEQPEHAPPRDSDVCAPSGFNAEANGSAKRLTSHAMVLASLHTPASPPLLADAGAAAAVASPHGASAWRDDPPGDTQRRLAAELDAKGVLAYSFLRVVGDYYDHSLEWRRECLGAPSVFHLCKSMVMHNTKAADAPDGGLPRYFLVILQYAAAVHGEKLKRVWHRAANRDRPAGHTIGKQFFNPRLVPEEVSDQLTGFQHNAVSPIGLATDLPIILSDRVAALQPPVFWLGGGEPDLKVCLPVHPFLEAYRPTVVDCTDDKRTIIE